MSNNSTYTVTTTVLQGTAPDNMAHWRADVGQLEGGDPAVVAAFNRASQASAQGQIDQFLGDRPPDWESSLEATGEVSFRSTAVAQLIRSVIVWSALHPPNWVSTVVIDSRTAKPITLSDLFADDQAGLNRLSDQAKLALQNDGTDIPADVLASGTAPTATNFVNWIPTDEGIAVHFDEYQFGGPAFARVATVPWSAVTDVLAPDMTGLAQA